MSDFQVIIRDDGCLIRCKLRRDVLEGEIFRGEIALHLFLVPLFDLLEIFIGGMLDELLKLLLLLVLDLHHWIL